MAGDAHDGAGATLSAAGFDGVEAPRSVSAIAAHVWAHFAHYPHDPTRRPADAVFASRAATWPRG